VWFSYKQDTLYLSRSVVENLLHSDLKQDEFGLEFSNVKKLLLGQPISDWLQHSGTKYERICEVIGWFGKLEHLALVSEDPAGVPVNSNFIVPKYECFDALLGFYKGGYTRERDVELQSFLTSITDQSRRRNEVETAGITAKREQWIQKREKLIRARIHVTSQIWQVPEVYRQLITTAERQAEYDQALEKYNKQKADYRMRVIMTTWGRENFLFSASQTSTVENMAEAFRAERRYSKKRDIKIRRAGQILKPETRIFDVANIERVDFFTATVR
jgi:hypothetical protein